MKERIRYCALCHLAILAGVSAADVHPAIVPENDAETAATHEVVWSTEAGMDYELQESMNLEAWTVAPGYPAKGSGESLRFGFTAADEGLFFRVMSEKSGPGQLLNLPLPADGTRMDSLPEFDGPRWPQAYGEGHVTLWHEGKFAAYSITIDDNNSPDFPFWREVSATYGWKLTWFVIVHPYVWDIYADVPGNNTGYFGTLDEFKALHDEGHDIQLHGNCSETNDLTAVEYEDHIVRSVNVLEAGTGSKVRSFAYPCGKIVSGDGLHDYREIISRYMIGARGTSGGVTPVHLLDYLNTKSLGVNALTDGAPNSLFTRYNDGSRALLYTAYRGWCVTLYHGLSNETNRSNALETFDFVKAHEDEFWVAPFTDVAKYAQERESHTLEITVVEADRIELEVSDRMDDANFDHPLTVKLRLAGDWTGISATQDGTPIAARIVEHDGAIYGLIEPVPDRGRVVLRRTEGDE